MAVSLDAADGERDGVGRGSVVGALDQAFAEVRLSDDLAAGTDPAPVPQARADQGVVHGHQTFRDRYADVAGELERCGARAVLRAVGEAAVGCGPSSIIAVHTARCWRREPGDSLKPAATAPDSSRMRAMKRTSSRGVENARWQGGETTVRPSGTSRTRAISTFTVAPAAHPRYRAWRALRQLLRRSPDALARRLFGRTTRHRSPRPWSGSRRSRYRSPGPGHHPDAGGTPPIRPRRCRARNRLPLIRTCGGCSATGRGPIEGTRYS